MSCRRSIATLAKVTPRDDALLRLSQELAELRARFAPFESGLAGNAAVAAQALSAAQDAIDASQNPRTITNVAVVNGHLIITFSDGTTQDAGVIGGIIPIVATLLNTLGVSDLTLAAIPTLLDQVNAIDARIAVINSKVTDANRAAVQAILEQRLSEIDPAQVLADILPKLRSILAEIEVAVAPPVTPTLNALTLSGALQTTAASSGTIAGLTSGSTITASGLSVNRSSQVYGFNGAVAAGQKASITETLGSVSRTTEFTVAAAPPAPAAASWYIGDPSVFVTNTDRFIGAGGGTAPGAIALTVGAIAPGTEGSGVTGITLTVGAISPANEGNPAQAITLTVGAITAAAEGTSVTLTVGAINPVAEGN